MVKTSIITFINLTENSEQLATLTPKTQLEAWKGFNKLLLL